MNAANGPLSTGNYVNQSYRTDIDGLRALAVLSVVTFHAFPSVIVGGFIGVDIFFVISGFLISNIVFRALIDGDFSFRVFYQRRINRIFPALNLVLIFCLGFGWLTLLADEYAQIGKHAWWGSGFLSNFVLWSESGYFDSAAEEKPLLHLWSLGIEEQFYIIWPLLLWLSWRLKSSFIVIITTVAISSFFANVYNYWYDPIADFYSPLSRFWELIFGAALAYAKLRSEGYLSENNKCTAWFNILNNENTPGVIDKYARNIASVGGSILIITGLLFVTKMNVFPGFWALLPTIGTLLIIGAGEMAWVNRQLLSNQVMVWVGLISFPLYLWHWPLLSFARVVAGETPSAWVRVVALTISVILAWLTYSFIERPIRYGAHGKFKALVLVCVMALIGYLGYTIYQAEGYEDRLAAKGSSANRAEMIRPPAVDSACLEYVGENAPIFNYCRFNDVGSRETYAVIGDSHAHAAFPGISNILANKGINTVLFANAECPPFLGAEYGRNGYVQNSCKARIESVIATVSNKSDITRVIIFSRGAVYISGKGFGEAENYATESPPIPPLVFADSLQRTVHAIQGAGKLVFYVTENPELGISPMSCIVRPFRKNPRNCSIDKTIVLDRQAEYLDIVSKIRGVVLINTLNAFCPHDSCISSANGSLLYADDDHLSVSGSAFQADILSQAGVFDN